MSQKSHCTQPTMYKYFYFKTEIKTKVDSYMPCEAMAHSPKSSDLKEYIHRSQVWVLLNFSMTDYTSQGKTRPKNPVDLSNCRSHQSYYTCLSRSATASGTVIVQ